MRLRLGDYLVAEGLLNAAQRDEILAIQRRVGRPFGVLAEDLFGVHPADVERAWAAQYCAEAERVDPADELAEPEAVARITRRQAWQFRCLPLRYEGATLVVATTREFLPRALRFSGWVVECPCAFVIAEAESLGRALMRYYPMDGASPELASMRRVA